MINFTLIFHFSKMKYGQLIFTRMAPEWKDAYADYGILKLLLKPLGIKAKQYMYLNINLSSQDIKNTKIFKKMPKYNITNLTKEDLEFLKDFNDKFEYMIWFEFQKVTEFFKAKLKEYLLKYQHFKMNISIISTMKTEPNYKKLYGELKNCFHLYYKEISILLDYYNVNAESFKKILKKQKKLCNEFPKKLFKLMKYDSFFNEKTQINKKISQLAKLKQETETLYLDFFYSLDKHQGKTDLNKISHDRLISHWENFYFGMFSGFTIFLLVIIIILGRKGDLDPDQDDRFNQIFHIYRGLALFIIYIWLLGCNVYGWTKYHINYKMIFRFNHHYSTLSEILKRAASFSTLFLFMFLLYVIFRENGEEVKEVSFYDYINKEVCPFVCWLIFWGYIFFPSIKYLNGEGRFYMFGILKKMFISSCFFVDFTLAWATDQMVSFVIPIRDFEYTICYYIHRIWFLSNIESCYSQEKITIAFIAATFPLLLRVIQCLRSMYQREKKFCFKIDFFNMIKYVLAMITVFFSLYLYLYPLSEVVFWGWIIFASLSTLYSYYWDLKMDWGFLDPNSKHKYLRNELSYHNVGFYYFAIVSNFLLRFSWILSLSSGIVDKSIRKELFTFLLGFLEMTRRAIWNFFRVEKEHIANMGLFRIVENYNLPFDNIQFRIEDKKILFNEFENSIDHMNKGKVSIDSGNSFDFDDFKNKVKTLPKYTFSEIEDEVKDFKNFVKSRDCFLISEDNERASLNSNFPFNHSCSLQGEEQMILDDDEEEYSPLHKQKNKLHRSITKYLEIDGKDPYKKKRDVGVVIRLNNAEISPLEIEEKKKKDFNS